MLGQELQNEFSAGGYETVGVDKNEIDITDFDQTNRFLLKIKSRIIINAAAYNAVDKIEESKADYSLARRINGDAIGNLAKFCREQNTILVHYSSDYVFAGDKEAGYKENDEVHPINKYGETKALGEKYLQTNAEKYYLIRLSKLFGKTGTGEGIKKNFVDVMLSAVENGKTHLDLVDEEQSCPTYAPDLAKFTRNIIEQPQPYGIYHGTNSGACSWYEWAKKIFEIKKIKIDLSPVSRGKVNRPAKRPMFSELLNTKAPHQRHWSDALKEYLSK